MQNLFEALAAELERPRELSPRVVNYLSGTYNVDYDAIGPFLVDELSKLEDYELDLILSPLFTPKLADQAVFADLLGTGSASRDQWPLLIQQLAARPIHARLVTADGREHSVTLREVTIERYVNRLRLDASIPAPLFKLTDQTSPAADRPMLKAIARAAIWENDARRNILEAYLKASGDTYTLADALELLNIVESQKPLDLSDLLDRMPRRKEALRVQIDAAQGPKPFLDAGAQAMHGGVRDQRLYDDTRRSAKEIELEFLNRLQKLLGG